MARIKNIELENFQLKNKISRLEEVAGIKSYISDTTIKGGYKIVNSLQERNDIDCCNRKVGMIVSVRITSTEYKNYRLIGNNACLNNWQEVTTDGDVPGPPGEAATIDVGTAVTLEPNEPVVVTNVGTSSEAIFNFEIPKGEKGDVGDVSLLNFNVNTAMHLIMNLETNTNLNFTLDNNGHLILLQ